MKYQLIIELALKISALLLALNVWIVYWKENPQ